jgi:hypothetical protein
VFHPETQRNRRPTARAVSAEGGKARPTRATVPTPRKSSASGPAPPVSVPVPALAIVESTECGVCFEKVQLRGQLDSCDHYFCFDCIQEWAKIENTCPHCKVRVHSLRLHVAVCGRVTWPLALLWFPQKRFKSLKKVSVRFVWFAGQLPC